MPVCSKCGQPFSAPLARTGRPRTRCDRCRSNQDRIDGSKWRKLRALVLAEEPYCAVCGRPSSEVDHIVPLQLGGDAYARSNLRGLCKRCNASKGAKVPRMNHGPRRWVL